MRALFLLLATLPATAQIQTSVDIRDFVRPGKNGVTLVKDPFAKLAFQLPKGWVLQSGFRWGDHETTLTIGEVYSGLRASLYYQYPLKTPRPADPDAALNGFMKSKVKQRQEHDELPDYHVRDGSVQRRTVAGRPALSYMAEFTNPDGDAMQEYMLRLMGANIKAHVFMTAPASVDIGPFILRLDAVAESIEIPQYP